MNRILSQETYTMGEVSAMLYVAKTWKDETDPDVSSENILNGRTEPSTHFQPLTLHTHTESKWLDVFHKEDDNYFLLFLVIYFHLASWN